MRILFNGLVVGQVVAINPPQEDAAALLRRRPDRPQAQGSQAGDGHAGPILVEARPNARWPVDFVRDQLSNGQRFRILNVIDDVTKECLVAIADTSISGRRLARELDTIIARRVKPDLIISNPDWMNAEGHSTPSRSSLVQARHGKLPTSQRAQSDTLSLT